MEKARSIPCFSLLVISTVILFKVSSAQVLRPPYFNIAQAKTITASSTCGYQQQDKDEGELFCKLATVPGRFGIQGLACDYCDPNNPSKDHPIEHAIDGSEKWWQSPPLSRGSQFHEVNITIELGQEFHVAYVIIKSGNAPRPGRWVLEKSVDDGATYVPWQYFATTPSECYTEFGTSPLLPLVDDDTVICTTAYSDIPPFENGEIHVSLVNGRPGAANFSHSKTLQEWTRATHVRLRLLKVKTLLSDLLPLAMEDPTVTRRYFYSVKDISIGGRCVCNGHADECSTVVEGKSTLLCNCKHNTCGPTCDRCCPGFEQKKWRPAFYNSPNECEPCNCHGHSNKCYYDELVAEQGKSLDIHGRYEGGGVCQDCQHNTEGINCERCKAGFYNPEGVPMTSPYACRPCSCDTKFSTGRCFDGKGDCECKENFAGPRCNQCNDGFYNFPDCIACECNVAGTVNKVCQPTTEQCPCKPNYTGLKCDKCAPGYFGFPECKSCGCDSVGSESTVCSSIDGQCVCKPNYNGRACDTCAAGFFNYPQCSQCNCDSRGTTFSICNASDGTCLCKENFGGPQCQFCNEGYFNFPYCIACGCSPQGAISDNCDKYGRCTCKPNYRGNNCDQCQAGYYDYPRCVACNCDTRGALNQYCNPSTGQCQCKSNFQGQFCNQCQPGFYGFPDCQRCRCNPAGIKPLGGRLLGDCSSTDNGQCDCKDNIQGLECNECKTGYFNLQASNRDGCEACACDVRGVVAALRSCDERKGNCMCKMQVEGRRCDSCKPGFYSLRDLNLFGCVGCDCDVGGAYDQNCDRRTGQCSCRENIMNKKCDMPNPLHFYPNLHHIVAEMEDGVTPEDTPARFGFDESVFPEFSWKGYAVINSLQSSIINTLRIPKSGNYHIVYRYMLDQGSPVSGQVVATQRKNSTKVKQSSDVTFEPTTITASNGKKFVTVAENGQLMQFALTEGDWDFTFTAEESELLLDYFFVLPVDYYQAVILKKAITQPCVVDGTNKLCNQYAYVTLALPGVAHVEAETGYIFTRAGTKQTQLYNNYDILQQLDFGDMALLDAQQTRVTVNIALDKLGQYVFVMQYFHPKQNLELLDLYLRARSGQQRGRLLLYHCPYKFGCRQVAVNDQGDIMVFDVKFGEARVVTLVISRDTAVAVDSIYAIPLDQWKIDHIVPSVLCTTQDNACIASSYHQPKSATKFEAEDFPPVIQGDEDIKPVNKDSAPADDGAETPGTRPANIFDTKTQLKMLQGPLTYDATVNIPKPGRYAVVIHYYQPYFTTYDAKMQVRSNVPVDGNVKLAYCPHTSGCRAIVTQSNNGDIFDFSQTSVTLTWDIPSLVNVWLDYVLFIPEAEFSAAALKTEAISQSKQFIESCAQDSFNVVETDSDFCKASVFSLTSHFNNGSQACACDVQGSTSDQCKKFAGQCSCKENIIGRTCSRCKVGYYGFPNCRKCGCPYCNPETGDCACPPNTIGQNCDVCVKGTYGYDPIIGCLKCRCDRDGVQDGNVVCDTLTGQCPCKPSRGGRRCHQCAVGYFGYPDCRKCDCDVRGSTNQVCDEDGKCLCKANVIGDRCDQCLRGHFNLEAVNPDGCTQCWCSGLSQECTSSSLSWTEMSSGENWTMTNIEGEAFKNPDGSLNVIFVSDHQDLEKSVYWKAPPQYLGNKVRSYGGKLKYSIQYQVPDGDEIKPVFNKPDVILDGQGIIIEYKKREHVEPGATKSFEINLRHYEWQKEDGSAVSHEEFMTVIEDINVMKFRASYMSASLESTLTVPVMNVAVTNIILGADVALTVEQCVCPDRRAGTSCGVCGQGFTQTLLGTCVACQCYGHSDICDPVSGVCSSCLDNTRGEHCELCGSGFYGDATIGSRDDCKYCSCPIPSSTNNFAESCSLSANDSLVCQCQEEYTGPTCGECADGYYGNPMIIGDYCKPCDCNGNIDPTAKGNCDSLTGECLKCVNNTSGPQCEQCHAGYYGDAIVEKNCAKCKCELCGSETSACDHESGACQCKDNVYGDTCESCQPNTWNYNSCTGCEDCACADAALSSSCDSETGQCECHSGVTGRRCERCKAGFWSYTPIGCQACNCGPESYYGFCDIYTGNCDCGPDGKNCTICPPYHILTPTGCEYCGECVERLFRQVEGLDDSVTDTLGNLRNSAAGLQAELKLGDLNRTLQRLKPRSKDYSKKMADLAIKVGSTEVELVELLTSGRRLKREAIEAQDNPFFFTLDKFVQGENFLNDEAVTGQDGSPEGSEIGSGRETVSSSDSLTGQVSIAGDNSTKIGEDAKSLVSKAEPISTMANMTKDHALDLEERIRNAIKDSDGAVKMAEDIASALKTDQSDKDKLLAEAAEMLVEIKSRDFSKTEAAVKPEHALALAANQQCSAYYNQTMALQKEAAGLEQGLIELLMKFQQMLQKSLNALESAKNAAELNEAAMTYDPETPMKQAQEKKTLIDQLLQMAQDLLQQARDALKAARDAFQKYGENAKGLDDFLKRLQEEIDRLSKGINDTRPSVNNSMSHAGDLQKQADYLRGLIQDTQQYAEKAVNASRAYTKIADLLKEALQIARQANRTATSAVGKSEGLGDDAEASKTRSEGLVDIALDAEGLVNDKLQKDLEMIEDVVADVKQKNKEIEDGLVEIEQTFPQFDSAKDLGDRAIAAADKADEADDRALDAKQVAEDIRDKLPGLKDLVISLTDTSKGIKDLEKLVEDAEANVIQEDQVIEELEVEQREIREQLDEEVFARIKHIRNMIHSTRNRINTVQLIMGFTGNSSAIIKPNKELLKPSTHTPVTFFIKTSAPDGFLMFLGEAGHTTRRLRRETQSDFVAFEIVSSKVQVHLQLGGEMTSIENPAEITPDLWHKVEMVRSGNSAQFMVTPHLKSTIVETRSLASGKAVLALDDQSEILVGGVPPNYNVPDIVKNRFYSGCMDGLKIYGLPVGLWNARVIKNAGVCQFRTEFRENIDQVNVHELYGDGHIEMYSSERGILEEIKFNFSTFNNDGLMLFSADKRNLDKFVSVEIENGHVVYRTNYGSGVETIYSTNQYNDGKNHVVLKTSAGELLVDNIPGNNTVKEVRRAEPQWIYVGGYSRVKTRVLPSKEISSKDFSGCINNLQFGTRREGLQPYALEDATFGCLGKLARHVCTGPDGGYVTLAAPRGSLKQTFKVVLSFKTSADDALLFYITSTKGVDHLTVGIQEKKVIVEVDAGGGILEMATDQSTYNDGKWHFVSVTQTGDSINLSVDDVERKSGNLPKTQRAIGTNSPLYIGGTPPSARLQGVAEKLPMLKGCVRDYSLDVVVKNFADYIEKQGVTFADIPIPRDELVVPTVRVTYKSTEVTEGPSEVTTEKATAEETTTEKVATEETTTEGVTTEETTTAEITTAETTVESTTEKAITTIMPTTSSPCFAEVFRSFQIDSMLFGQKGSEITVPGSVLSSSFKLFSKQSNFVFQIKTMSLNGIIIYTSNIQQNDYLVCYMLGGKLHFAFNSGSGELNLVTDRRVNDGLQHTIRLRRQGRDGWLYLDDQQMETGSSKGGATTINALSNLYIGGVPSAFFPKRVPEKAQGSFQGCIANMRLDDKEMPPSELKKGTRACTVGKLEAGVFIPVEGGHMVLVEGFAVGLKRLISVDIRPQTDTGVILSVASPRGDYLSLEMENGKVFARVQNGAGEIMASWSSKDDSFLCDGKWHSIQMLKDGNNLELTVDGNTVKATGKATHSNADIKDPLYIGGLPDGLSQKGVTTTGTFSGCIRNLRVNDIALPLNRPFSSQGALQFGGCDVVQP